jgi:hypothetical protein
MDVSTIVSGLKAEKKEHAQQVVLISRVLRIFRRLRSAPRRDVKQTMRPSVAANRLRGRKAWQTRMRNQRAKLSVMKSKRAA